MSPILGKLHIGYLPDKRVVGISKLARVADSYAKRLQIQEKLTAQIANCVEDVLRPLGVAVVIEAQHQCMTTRGVHKTGVSMDHQPDARCLPQFPGDAPRVPVADWTDRRTRLVYRRGAYRGDWTGRARGPMIHLSACSLPFLMSGRRRVKRG